MKRLAAALAVLLASTAVVFALGWSPSTDEPVAQALFTRLPATLELLAGSFVVTVLLGGIAGFARARARLPVVRGAVAGLVLVCRAIPLPVFVMLVLLTSVFFVRGLPLGGIASSETFDLRDRLAHLVAPVVVLGVPFAAWSSLIFCHIFRVSSPSRRSAVAATVMTAAVIGPALAAATVLVEPWFARPGIARVFYSALQQFDVRLVAGSLVMYLGAVLAVRLAAPATITEEGTARAQRSLSPVGVGACIVLGAAAAAAAAAPLIAPVGPYYIDIAHWSGYPLAPGVAGHLLGTDENGRDLLARLLFGLRTSLTIAVGAALVAAALAAAVAKAAGALRRFETGTVLGVTGIRPLAGLPLILAAVMVIVARWRSPHVPSPLVVAALIAAVSWPAGIPAFRAFGRRTLGGGVGLIAGAFLLETTISLLGFGVQPPIASLGNMLVNAEPNITVAPWAALVPAVTITAVLLALYALADDLCEPA
ncbi:MAG TPA: hypothetical protein VHS78_01945 [Candidatus Elarobacter sp.]|nr:hypothetical protein [Candidatus Elarobacter sp.]